MLEVFVLTVKGDFVEIFCFWLFHVNNRDLASALLDIEPLQSCKELVGFDLLNRKPLFGLWDY